MPVLSVHHRLNIVAFAKDILGFEPDPVQAQALDPGIRRGILNCCRQWGKSTTVAIRMVHQVLLEPGTLVVICSPSKRQSAELVRKAAHFLRKLGIRFRRDPDHAPSILLPNEARIIGLPAAPDTIRGFSKVSLLLVDEASRVSDEIYEAARPMLAACPGAALWLLSTPNGRQGFFYETWHSGGPEWTRISAPATECPRIPPEFLADERRALKDSKFRQEYLCEFVSADFSYFDAASIDAAFYQPESASAPPNLQTPVRYYLGLDLGQTRDYSAVAIVERRVEFTGEVDPVTFARRTATRIVIAHLERIPLRTSYPDVVERIRTLVEDQTRKKRRLEILMDATGVGAAVRDMLKAAGLGVPVTGITITSGEHVIVSQHNLYHVPRPDLLVNLRVLLEKRMLSVTAAGPAVEQLRTEFYRWGRRSAHDDLIFAVALAAWKAAGQPVSLNGPGPLPLIHPEVRP